MGPRPDRNSSPPTREANRVRERAQPEVAELELHLSQLGEELEVAEQREDDLLGTVNANRQEMARLRRSIEEIQMKLKDKDRPLPALDSEELVTRPSERAAGYNLPGGPRDETERTAIAVRNLSKAFQVPSHHPDTFKEQVLHPLRSRRFERLQALDSLSFTVGKGEFLGIAGPNGSGKSTLLKILASIYAADGGTVRAAGRIAPFIELGAGLNPELAAYDNVVISGVLMGLEPDEAKARFEDVIAFAGLEKFTEMKLKNYSSGMTVRLAFSVMAQVDADILLIDEVLAVGDAEFREKCLHRLRELRSAGTTIVLVSHAMEALIQHCDRALMLEHGRIVLDGDPGDIAQRYSLMGASAHA